MSDDPVDRLLVRAIIGDIREAFDPTSDEFDDIEPITDEEADEIEADWEANKHLYPEPTPEETERFVAMGMKVVRFILYKQDMQKRGLSHVDYHEWMNTAVEPTVPEE